MFYLNVIVLAFLHNGSPNSEDALGREILKIVIHRNCHFHCCFRWDSQLKDGLSDLLFLHSQDRFLLVRVQLLLPFYLVFHWKENYLSMLVTLETSSIVVIITIAIISTLASQAFMDFFRIQKY